MAVQKKYFFIKINLQSQNKVLPLQRESSFY